jgi:hypothetical protein
VLQRIFETFNVHKFSHATMPIFNLFKNCSYYWSFAAFVSFFINHPLYTPPPVSVTVGCLVCAYFCQVCPLIMLHLAAVCAWKRAGTVHRYGTSPILNMLPSCLRSPLELVSTNKYGLNRRRNTCQAGCLGPNPDYVRAHPVWSAAGWCRMD